MSSVMTKRIVIEAVPQNAMRPPYSASPEAGDWFVNAEGDLVIRVIGETLDDPQPFLFALHELIEAKLCRVRGISQEAVDAFDAAFTGDGEPGDMADAPYRKEHRQAMLIEMLMANFLGLDDYGEIR